MIELVVLGVVLLALVMGGLVLSLAVGVLGFLFTLPFRILGWMLGAVGVLLGLVVALPVLLVAGIGVGLAVLLTGGLLLLPLAPLLLLVWVVWKLLPGKVAPTHESGARVVS